jgi:pyrroline-5-carboxylate reductase
MGSAIAAGLLDAETQNQITVFDTSPAVTAALASKAPGRVHVAQSAQDVIERCGVVVLAVKPSDFKEVLRTAARIKTPCLFVSIAAGLQTQTLREMASPHHRVVRAMPNTPALVREGCTTVLADRLVTPIDAAKVEALFSPLGQVITLHDEALMDPATALAGSGPAFIALVVEALSDAAVAEGLPRALALRMATQTVRGAATLMRDQHPALVKDNVGSPGGTTMAGVCAAEQHGLRASLIAAVRAACERSRQMR